MSTYNLLDEPWIPVRWGANAGAPPPAISRFASV